MSDSLDGASVSGALQNKEEMRRWMRAVNRNVLRYRNTLDTRPINFFVDDPLTVPTQQPTPPPVSFTVVGVDGQFQITITLPQDAVPPSVSVLTRTTALANPLGTAIVHQLQSASNTNFDAAAGVQTYGPFTELTQTFQVPNQTLFWRIRSSFDGVNWNAWQIYSSATTCGPVGVSSGFLRSTSGAPNMALNTSNNCTVDSIDNGTNATIRVYGPGGVGTTWIHFDGQGGQTTLPYSTITAPYNTDMIVLYSTANGLQAFPTATQYINALQDTLLFSGKLHTVSAGGGGGSSGGGGGSDGGGGGGRGLLF